MLKLLRNVDRIGGKGTPLVHEVRIKHGYYLKLYPSKVCKVVFKLDFVYKEIKYFEHILVLGQAQNIKIKKKINGD